MRLRFALVFGLALALAACGEDEPPPPQQTAAQRPAPPPADTQQQMAQPEPEPEPEPMPEPATPVRGRLYTVQVAAFLSPDSARKWSGRLASQGLPVWTTIHEVQGRMFHRVRVGAVPTVGEARQLGEILKQRYEWPTWVAPVTPAEPVPDGAVEATQDLIRNAM